MHSIPELEWYNEPQSWTAKGDSITVTADAKTDFWRKTHYGFIRDSGHFFFRKITGDFVADVRFSGAYQALYDQAGLMVRVDDANWLKCGVEFVDGIQQVSAVVTRDYSDWSVMPLPENPPTVFVRLKYQEGTVEMFFSLDAAHYTMIRTAFLSPAETAQVGLMCAAPQGGGFSVTFEGLAIRPL